MSKQSRKNKKKSGYVPYQHEEPAKKNKGSAEIKNGVFMYEGDITVDELARKLKISPAEIVKSFFLKGKMLTINSILDDELIAEICVEHNYDFERQAMVDPADFSLTIETDQSKLQPRPPIITVMGHVDHGKTTLIDRIRHSAIAGGEAGGITQVIGAYQKDVHGNKVTILDTPGHEAFTAMRARGTKVGDIAILVVAADDGVMPQTKEAIDHAKAAKLPIIVAINKTDKPGATPDKVMGELSALGLAPEAWGGTTVTCQISAKTGAGIDELLDNVLTMAELLELKANPNRLAEGTVIDSALDKREGPKATLLVQNGSLHVGDYLVAGENYGKVRRMINEFGKALKVATPSTPVSIIGLAGVPVAGDLFRCFPDEKTAKQVATERQQKMLTKLNSQGFTLANALAKMSDGETIETQMVNLIVKTDSQGSAEALKDALLKIAVPSVKLNLIRCTTGEVSEGDVVLAQASTAVIITFNVKASGLAAALAKEKHIEIRPYGVIYKLIGDVTAAMKGRLKPIFQEHIYGHAEVRAIFRSSKAGEIAGCYVVDGKIVHDSEVRIYRQQKLLETTKLTSLKHVKDDIKEAKLQSECGLTVALNFKFQEGDIVESFGLVEVANNG